jgi:transcriptional regulator with XRE-family HTH domain
VSRHRRRHPSSQQPKRSQSTPHISPVQPKIDSSESATAEPAEVFEAVGGLAIPTLPGECLDDRAPSPGLDADHSAGPGAILQNHRQARGLTLDDIARTTKVNRQILRAIENADATHLPAAIYTRGFVKAYADAIGLNPELTADEYMHALHPAPMHSPGNDHQMTGAGARAGTAGSDEPRPVLAFNQLHRATWLALAAAGIGLLVYVASRDENGQRTTAVVDVIEQHDAVRAGGLVEARFDGTASAPVKMINDGPLRMEFAPQAPCWVSIRVGGETIFAKLLQPGDREIVDVVDEAVVRVGEPGALSFSINGQSGRALGPAGQPVTVRITKDNFRDFLIS